MHPVRARRGPDPGGVRHRRPARRRRVRRRGAGGRGGPPGPPVRRPVRAAPRPADGGGDGHAPRRGRVHPQHAALPPARQPRPAARGDRGLLAVARGAARPRSSRRSSSPSATSPRSSCSTPSSASPSCGAAATRGATACSCPTYHPAAVLRGGGAPMAQMRADLVRAKHGRRRCAAHRHEPPVMSEVVARTAERDATQALGEALAGLVEPGDLVLLSGEMGAGKTAFTQGFGPGPRRRPSRITSPTFTIAHQYDGPAHDAPPRRLPARAPATRRSTSGWPRSSTRARSCVIEWGDAIVPVLPARLPRGAPRVRRRRRRPRARGSVPSGGRWVARAAPPLRRRAGAVGGAPC